MSDYRLSVRAIIIDNDKIPLSELNKIKLVPSIGQIIYEDANSGKYETKFLEDIHN